MRLRHVMGLAIFCGALCTAGGQTAQAQTPNSARFVQLLLINQTSQIRVETNALNKRANLVARLDAATNSRQARTIGRTLSRLNAQILSMTARLVLLTTQTYSTAVNLTPSNPGLVSQALAALLTVQQISAQVGLGITPATPSQ